MDMKLEEIDFGISTADEDNPVIEFDGRDLVIRYKDWRENQVIVSFPEADMFSWSEIPQLFTEAPDRTYEAFNTFWLNMDSVKGQHYHHYMLCFNASYYYLQVLCEGVPASRVQ